MSSSRSRSTMACKASPVGLSRVASGSASSQAAYSACRATNAPTVVSHCCARVVAQALVAAFLARRRRGVRCAGVACPVAGLALGTGLCLRAFRLASHGRGSPCIPLRDDMAGPGHAAGAAARSVRPGASRAAGSCRRGWSRRGCDAAAGRGSRWPPPDRRTPCPTRPPSGSRSAAGCRARSGARPAGRTGARRSDRTAGSPVRRRSAAWAWHGTRAVPPAGPRHAPSPDPPPVPGR